MEYRIETYRLRLSQGWGWQIVSGEGSTADGIDAPDEPTARKCAQAVIDALSPQPTTPMDACCHCNATIRSPEQSCRKGDPNDTMYCVAAIADGGT